jgi:hypothetical protein
MPASTALAIRPSAAGLFRLMIFFGFLPALAIAAVVAAIETFEASRNCRGAFSSGFSAGFDKHRCELVVRLALKSGFPCLREPDFFSMTAPGAGKALTGLRLGSALRRIAASDLAGA